MPHVRNRPKVALNLATNSEEKGVVRACERGAEARRAQGAKVTLAPLKLPPIPEDEEK